MRLITGTDRRSWRGVATAALMTMALGLVACGDDSLTDANTSAALGDSDASAILSDMTGDLGLTDDQKSELRSIAQDYSTRMDEPGVTWYAAADVQAVLTSDQIAKIGARRQELRDRITDRVASAGFGRGDVAGRDGAGRRGMRRGSGGAGIGGGPWADSDLGLTEAQKDAIQDVLEKYRPQMEDIRDQVQDGSLTREEAHDLASTIRDSIRTEVEALLTQEQLDALEARRGDFEDRKSDREDAREAMRLAMVDALSLTAAQQAQIDALRDASKSADTGEDRRDAHRSALTGILTEEQMEIFTVHEAFRGHGVLRRLSGAQRSGSGAQRRGSGGQGFGGR